MTGRRPDRVPETCTSDTVCVRVLVYSCAGAEERTATHVES